MFAAAPLEDAEFARLMAPFAPFEPAPELAAAVSGGADSLCLAWLAARWAAARGGRVAGLVVDHGLRPESAAEARKAARRLESFGVAARILRWRGAKPATGVQAAARAARYRLLAAACREAGILHLLAGHHAGDQAETAALRRAAGSGPDGLAGMSAVVERGGVRVLRPLLPAAPARLRATLARRGLAWAEDPSNGDPAQARAATRRALARTGGAAALAAAAAARGRRRADREARTARLVRRAVRLDPLGRAVVDLAALAEAPEELARAVAARVLRCVGGRVHAPRGASLSRALARLAGGEAGAFTLGGCAVAARGGTAEFAREAAPIPDLPVAAGAEARWDGRFALRVGADPGGAPPYRVRRLDDRAWSVLRRGAEAPVPPRARPGLPALWDLDGPLALPHLSAEHRRGGAPLAAEFRPARPLAGPGFAPAADPC